MSGFWAGDSIAQAMDNARLQKALNEQKKYYNEIAAGNAGNLAEKMALREALRKLDPKHPLLTDENLQGRVQNAGIQALATTDNWEAVREAGAAFKY